VVKRKDYDDVNKLRYDLFKSRYEIKSNTQQLSVGEGIDLSLIPPCKSSLHMHNLRVCYQTYMWKESHVQYSDIPSPVGCGWKLDSNKNIEIDWIYGDLLPQNVVDILVGEDKEESAEDDREEIGMQDIEEDCEIDNMVDLLFDEDDDNE
jgi:hypothetical protein